MTVRHVAFIVFPGFQIIDLTGPLCVFEIANEQAEDTVYSLQTLSVEGGLVRSSAGLHVASEVMADHMYDTVVIVGGLAALEIATDPQHVDMVRAVNAGARRMTSVCTGAFLLGGAGLLDGCRATTHWRFASLLQRQFPAIRVEPDHIYIRHGPMWSSAGATAGIDLALALVEEDLGANVSRDIARELVIYHRRPGGQAQSSALLEIEPRSDRIKRALLFAREHLSEPLNVGVLAKVAALSERQFGRAFKEETGETPARAIERLRAEAARINIENGREPVELVSAAVGFRDTERMRRAFLRIYGQPPQAMRRVSRAKSETQPE